MEWKKLSQEVAVVLFASLILALSFTFPNKTFQIFLTAFTSFVLIILINTLAKKLVGYHLETNVFVKFWTTYHWGLRKFEHFKQPLPMAWLPIITSLISYGNFIWAPILEFDVFSRPERVSRRHGLYRFTEVTEWHMALIALFGIFANVFFAILFYFFGFETFARYSIIYAFWSIIPFGRLDGTKIFFGSRNLWIFSFVILLFTLFWGLIVII